MDILCPICGEPWDQDELHDMWYHGRVLPYRKAVERFQALGCEAFQTAHRKERDRKRAAAARAMYDILGDDMDAASAEFEDLDSWL